MQMRVDRKDLIGTVIKFQVDEGSGNQLSYIIDIAFRFLPAGRYHCNGTLGNASVVNNLAEIRDRALWP
jgi:hypothetical protein